MRYDGKTDPLWYRWYKKAIWSRKTPLLCLVALFIYTLAVHYIADCWLAYIFIFHWPFVALLFLASVAIMIRPFLYERKQVRAFIKLAAYWSLVIGLTLLNTYYMPHIIQRIRSAF